MLGILSTLIIVVCIGFLIYFDVWTPSRPVKSQVAICAKCKYCVKTGWWDASIKQTRCRRPNDMIHTDFVTGKVEYPKYSCRDRNNQGTCSHYKKVWWRR